MRYYIFNLLLLTCCLKPINAQDKLLTGNKPLSGTNIPALRSCQEEIKNFGSYKYLPNAVPLVRKDITEKPHEAIPFALGVLTDGNSDFQASGVIFDNNHFGPDKPDPNYIEASFSKPCLISSVSAVAYEQAREYNLEKAAVRFFRDDAGLWGDWMPLNNITGKKTSATIYNIQLPSPVKCEKIQFYFNGHRKVGLSEIYITGTPAPQNLEQIKLILPEHHSKQELFAAKLLQKYLGEITGDVPPINSEKNGENGIFIGRCQKNIPYIQRLKNIPESFWLRSENTSVHIAGNDNRGTLYAALEFLELQGVYFVTPAPYGTVIPPKGTRLKLSGIDVKMQPRFAQRFIGGNLGGAGKESHQWGLMNRLNGPYENSILPGMGRSNQFWAHSYQKIVSPTLFSKFPNRFALNSKGQRMQYGIFCTTDPQNIAAGRQAVKRSRADYITISPDDGRYPDDYCHCLTCRELDANDNVKTDRVIAYSNALADSCAPGQKLMVLAYSCHRKPPMNEKPADNIIVQYCLGDTSMNIAEGLAQSHLSFTQNALRELKAWKKATRHLEVYMYYQNGKHTVGPFPVLSGLDAMLNDLKDIGVEGFYTQSQSVDGHFSIFYYILSRSLFRAESAGKILANIAPLYYGAGGVYMIRYFENWEKFIAKEKISVYGLQWEFPQKLNDGNFLSEQRKLLEQAKQSAVTENEKLRIDQVILEFMTMDIFLSQKNSQKTPIVLEENSYAISPGSRKVSAEVISDWKKLAARLGISDIANFDGKKLSIDHAAMLWNVTGERRMKVDRLSNGKIKISIIPELGGRIIQMQSSDGKDIFHIPEYFDSDNTFGGYEEYAGLNRAAGGWQEKYTVTGRTENSISLKCILDKRNIEIRRTIKLLPDSAVVKISSELINHNKFSINMAVRSKVLLPENMLQLQVKKDGKEKIVSPDGKRELWLSGKQLPDGVWSLANEKYRLINSFSVDEAETAYIYWGNRANPQNSAHYISFELFGKNRTVMPGGMAKLTQSFELKQEK